MREGRAARAADREARASRSRRWSAPIPRNVVFTSGGTEANALALTPHRCRRAASAPFDRLLVSAIEHPSVLARRTFRARGRRATCRSTAHGVIDLGSAASGGWQASAASALVSLMLANNETGVIQPVAQAADIVHEAGGLLHVDAVQAAGPHCARYRRRWARIC